MMVAAKAVGVSTPVPMAMPVLMTVIMGVGMTVVVLVAVGAVSHGAYVSPDEPQAKSSARLVSADRRSDNSLTRRSSSASSTSRGT